jgi:outer membrane protein assembly factor BamA
MTEHRLKQCLSAPYEDQGIYSHQATVIDSVDFDGPTQLSETEREGLLSTLRHTYLGAKLESLDDLEDAVREFWQARGYFRVAVKAQPEPKGTNSAGQHFAVVVHVDEGLQYRLREIGFTLAPSDAAGPDEAQDSTSARNKSSLPKRSEPLAQDQEASPQPYFSDAVLRGAIPINDGDVLDADKIRKGLDTLRKLYGRNGYIDFTAEPMFDVNDEQRSISMVVALDEQPQFRYGSIALFGLNPSAERSLRSQIKSGDIFDFDVLRDFFEQHKSILPPDAGIEDVELKRHLKAATVDLTIDIRPCP